MSGLKRKVTKRILAFTLTLAMAMSNMTVMASELTPKEDPETIVSEVPSSGNYNENGDGAETTEDADTLGDAESTDGADTSDDADSTDGADTSDDVESAEDTDTPDGAESTDDTDEVIESDEEGAVEEDDEKVAYSIMPIDGAEGSQDESGISPLDVDKYDVNVTTEGLDDGDKSNVKLDFTLAADYVLDVAEELTAGAQSDGTKCGTNDYFKIICGSNTVNVNDAQNKVFEDGYVGTARINPGGNSNIDSRVVEFTTSDAATVKVWWVPGANDRGLSIRSTSDGNTNVATTGEPGNTNATISELKLTDSGTYRLGGYEGTIYIFKIEVYNGDIPESETFGIDSSIQLAEGTYNVGVKLSDGLNYKTEVSSNPLEVKSTGDNNLTVKFIKQADVTGMITWGGADGSDKVDPTTDKSKLSIKFTSEESGVSSVTAKIDKTDTNTDTYTASGLNIGETYTVKITGTKDYTLVDSAETEPEIEVKESGNTLDFTFKENERYEVTVNPTGLTSEELKDVKFTFTDKDATDYKYEFTGTDGIKLRAGTYTVALSEMIDGYKVDGQIADLEVKDSTAVLAIAFKEAGDEEQGGGGSAEPVEYVFDATKVDATGVNDKDAIAEGPTYEPYFKYVGKVTQRVSGGATTSVEVDKNATGAIEFTVNGTADVTVVMSSTGTDNDSTIGLINESSTVVENNEKITETHGTGKTTMTYTGLAAGTYRVVSPGTTYNRGARLYEVTVVQTSGGARPPRADWDTVGSPVIKDVVQDGSNIKVTVEGTFIGYDGADSVSVTMADSAGTVIDTVKSSASSKEGEEIVITFTPDSTGTYTFAVFASRADEEDKVGTGTKTINFLLPLKTPSITSGTSLGIGEDGKGSVEIEWGAVPEATKYVVKAVEVKTGTQDTNASAPITKEVDSKTLVTVITGLTINARYSFTVTAVREIKGKDPEEKVSEPIQVTASEDAKQKWSFSAYGASTSISGSSPKDGYEGNANEGEVRVWSTGNGGKIVPASCGDGLAFYYTEVPADTNFTLSATANVNTWTYSNGQEGFGLMAADSIGVNGDSSTVWTNSYMAMVSKVEYFWNGESVADSGDDKYSMYLGVGSLARTGVTKAGLDEMTSQNLTAPKGFNSDTYSLDTTAATNGYSGGSYNIVGNCTNLPNNTIASIKEYTQFRLIIQKNNTGYFVSYVNPETGRAVVKKYYDTSALNKLSDTVYVGFFAARNADVTFDNISFMTIAPEEDDPAEEQPISYVTPSYQVISSSISNSKDYELVFSSNWNGELVIRDDMGNRVTDYVDRNGNIITDEEGNLKAEYKGADDNPLVVTDENGTMYAYPDIENYTVKVTGTLDPTTAADKIDTKIRAKVKLDIGANNFKVTFKPSTDFAPDDYTQLSSYDAKTFTHTVTYRKYGSSSQALYVSPTGTSSGNGSKESPLDIYTAVKYVQAGQTIILADGTYKLTKTVTVDRGISGTKDNMIYMIAEHPSADTYTSNVVFDFGGRCAGMVLAGDYWYFSGFDVTNSADGQKGIQLSGSHCVFDQLKTYKNGNTGIQLSRYKGTDMTQAEWPSYNTIRNCTSYLNADSGYEDADGFAAKLTIGPGNVFDGCIAFYNADDGWDLFAKAENGPIGMVTIRNCVTYKNGYVLRDATGALSLDGTEVDAGNGNGFKMGGESISGHHTLENSISFFNKAKGFDSNSCPDIQVYNSITFNNESYNVAFYTNNAANTDFIGEGIISYRKVSGKDDKLNVDEQLKPAGTQDKTKYENESSYFWNTGSMTSANSKGNTVSDDWFEFITTDIKEVTIDRNPNGTINTHGFLVLTDKAGVTGGLGEGTASEDVTDKREGDITDGTVDKGDNDNSDGSGNAPGEDLFDDNYKEEDLWTITVEPQTYTGSALKPEVRVYRGDNLLTQGKEYSIKYKNNINASVKWNAESGGYEPIYEDVSKLPTITVTGKGSYEGSITRTFEIRPVDISKEAKLVVANDITIIAAKADKDQTSKAKPTVTFNGKKLTQDKDYTVDLTIAQTSAGTPFKDFGHWNIELTGTGNFEGTNTITMHILDKSDKNNVIISNAKADIPSDIKKNAIYTGEAWEPEISSIKVGSDTYEFKADANGKAAADSPYTLEYYNNVNAGTASVVIVGNGSIGDKYYTGTKTLTFKIKSGKLDKKNFTVYSNKYEASGEKIDSIANQAIQYEGQAITFPRLVVTNNAIKAENRNLKLGEDYTVTYKKNKKAGKASVVIKGINNYSGSITKTFKIAAYDIKEDKNGWVGGSYKTYETKPIVVDYSASGAKPPISLLINGRKQVLGTDYTVTYSNNKKISTDTSKAKAVIKGKGALKGTLTVPYSINRMDISDPEANVTVKVNDAIYASNKKKGNQYQSKVTLYDNGKAIPSSAYDVKYYLVEEVKDTAADEEEVSAAAVRDTRETPLDRNTSLPSDLTNGNFNSGYTVKATITIKDNNRKYTGTITAEYRIARWNIANAKISAINPKYYGYETKLYSSDLNTISYDENGQEYVSESKVTYKPAGQSNPELLRCDKLEGDFYIDDTTFKNTGKVGTAKVTIRGVGKYGGTKVLSYKINKMSWDVKKAVLNEGAAIIEDDIILSDNGTIESVKSDVFKNRIKLNGVYLKYGVDFELSTDPKYAPKRKRDQLTVTIVGKDSYGGINSKITFAIEKPAVDEQPDEGTTEPSTEQLMDATAEPTTETPAA